MLSPQEGFEPRILSAMSTNLLSSSKRNQLFGW